MTDREQDYVDAGINIDAAFDVAHYFLNQARWETWPENVVRQLCEVWFGEKFELIPERRNADELYGIEDFREVSSGANALDLLDADEE